MANGDGRDAAAAALAAEVVELSRQTLAVELRFLDRALGQLEPTAADAPWLGTDGRRLFYEPWYILALYKAEPACVDRNVLHTLLHCVFRHGFVGPDIDRSRWDLACDVAVEDAINGLDAPAVSARRRFRQRPVLEPLRKELGTPTAERVYRWLRTNDVPPEEVARVREDFLADEHALWYGAAPGAEGREQDEDREEIWEQVSRRMQTELETLRRDGDGALVQNLRSLNRSRRSYTDFLRRFGVWGETLRLSDEEFDNNYYAYGLELYGNMPLIEPLEYREQRRIREFVIVIDTSGSVRGDVVQSFVQHTHDILLRQENFFTRVNMHILQCDDRVREDALITSKEDFDQYLARMEIRGLGQTDFRPAFAHVDELLRQRKLTELRGLLYFTDGRGVFPAKKPAYDTAFILHRTDYEVPEVPAWAMSLVLTEDDILDKRFGGG